MGTIIIIAIIVVLCVYAIYTYGRKLRSGGGCCGEHDPMEKKVKVADRDKRNYPYAVTLSIDGMTCSNCSRRVENALNQMPGVWAKVDLGSGKADVRLKDQMEEERLREAVRQAGYVVLSVE